MQRVLYQFLYQSKLRVQPYQYNYYLIQVLKQSFYISAPRYLQIKFEKEFKCTKVAIQDDCLKVLRRLTENRFE